MTNRLKTLDWMADFIYPLVIILMETFWVYPCLVWLGNFPMFEVPRPPLSLASVFITLGAATLAVRLLLKPKYPIKLVQAAILLSGLAVILLVLGVEYGAGYTYLSGAWFAHVIQTIGKTFKYPDTLIIALPALLYLWWRGTNLAQMTFNFKNIYRTFLIGITAIITLIILWQISSASGKIPGPGPGIGYDVLAVFFFGLMAIAIAHLYTMRSSMPKEEAALTSVWRWLPTMLAVIGGMIVIVFVIAGIFSPGFFSAVAHLLGIVWNFLTRILNYVIIPLNYIFEAIIWVLRWLIARIPRGDPVTDNNTNNMTMADIFGQTEQAELSPALIMVFKWLFIIAVIALVIFILVKTVSRYRTRNAAEEIEEIHESLFSWRGLGNDLKELLNNLGQKFQRQKPPATGYTYEDEPGRLDVREAYRYMLWEASRSGLKRSRNETPEEYSKRMDNVMPETHESLEELTDMYIDVRYGEIKPPEEKVDRANGLWQVLRSIFKEIRGR
jgi:hypothetical protein